MTRSIALLSALAIIGLTAQALVRSAGSTRPAATRPATQPAASQPGAAQGLLLTSGRLVFAMQMDQDFAADKPAWQWTAPDCDNLDARASGWFLAMDDAKPVLCGTHVLATSSGGGVALIRRRDNACVFYAPSTNAHTAEIVRGRWLAVASSFRGNELQVFDLEDTRRPAEKVTSIRLRGAHGLVCDWRHDILWALGDGELLKTKIVEQPGDTPIRIEVLRRLPLPKTGGHDLFPYFHYKHAGGEVPATAKGLFVTVVGGVYVFDLETETFLPFAPLADTRHVKSIGDNLQTGQIVYTEADEGTPFTARVRFLQPAEVRRLPAKLGVYPTRLYKARWQQPNPFSYPEDAGKDISADFAGQK